MTPYEELWYAIQRLNMRLREHERLKQTKEKLKDLPAEKKVILEAQVSEARRQLDDEKSTVVALLLDEA